MDITDLGHDSQRRLFGKGKTPFYISGPWDVAYTKQTLGIEKFTIISFPEIDGKKPKPCSGFRNMYITVMSSASGIERRYATALFILYVIVGK